MNRFKKSNPCPICGGGEDLARGKGKRCAGFLSDDGVWAHCSREELAGTLTPTSAEPPTFGHRLEGDCGCGVVHGPARQTNSNGIEAEYDYTDEEGALLFQVVRKPGKKFVQRRRDKKSGDWVWSLGDTRRVVYRLPKVVAEAEAGGAIYIAEGEKDVHALESIGLVATCNSGGAGKWRDAYTASLSGASITVVADRDSAGLKHATDVAASCRAHGLEVRIVEPAAGKDAADHVAAGHDTSEFIPLRLPNPLADLLDAIVAVVRKYVVMTDEQRTVLALFVAHTHTIAAADTTPYMAVTSAAKRSGKSVLLELLEFLVARGLRTSNISDAALFRLIDERKPTLLFDEVDAVFHPKSNREELRSLLNSGYRRGLVAHRCVGDGTRMRVEEFDPFGPKVLAGIGNLPDTVGDRAFPIRLKRKAKSERVERFRVRTVRNETQPLHDALLRWSEEQVDALTTATPTLPHELDDRGQDAAEPLLAIADAAGGEWPEKARNALVTLRSVRAEVDEESDAIQLLTDIREVWPKGTEQLLTRSLLEHLFRCESSPWADWWAEKEFDREFGVTTVTLVPNRAATMKLARMLKPFGVRSHDVGPEDARRKGYRFADFADAFSRYLSNIDSEVAQVAQTSQVSQESPKKGRAGSTRLRDLEQPVSVSTTPNARPARPETPDTGSGARNGACEHPAFWLARDGQRRCVNCDPPAFPGEVISDPVTSGGGTP